MRKHGTEGPLETLLYSIMLHDATRLADCLVISNSNAAATKAQGLEHWQHSTPYMASLNVLSSSFGGFALKVLVFPSYIKPWLAYIVIQFNLYFPHQLVERCRFQKRDFLLTLLFLPVIIVIPIIIYYQLKVAEKVELSPSFAFCNLPRNDFNQEHNVATRSCRKHCILLYLYLYRNVQFS